MTSWAWNSSQASIRTIPLLPWPGKAFSWRSRICAAQTLCWGLWPVLVQNLICCKTAVSCMVWGKILGCLLFPPILVKQGDSQEWWAPLHPKSFVLDTPHCKPRLPGAWTKALSGPCEAPSLDLRVILRTHLFRKVLLTNALTSCNLTLSHLRGGDSPGYQSWLSDFHRTPFTPALGT